MLCIVGTGVEHRLPFLLLLLQACGLFYAKYNDFRKGLKLLVEAYI